MDQNPNGATPAPPNAAAPQAAKAGEGKDNPFDARPKVASSVDDVLLAVDYRDAESSPSYTIYVCEDRSIWVKKKPPSHIANFIIKKIQREKEISAKALRDPTWLSQLPLQLPVATASTLETAVKIFSNEREFEDDAVGSRHGHNVLIIRLVFEVYTQQYSGEAEGHLLVVRGWLSESPFAEKRGWARIFAARERLMAKAKQANLAIPLTIARVAGRKGYLHYVEACLAVASPQLQELFAHAVATRPPSSTLEGPEAEVFALQREISSLQAEIGVREKELEELRNRLQSLQVQLQSLQLKIQLESLKREVIS